jgi:hypothetical protein
VTDTPTTIDSTNTQNHKKLVYDDGSVSFTYETDEGYYSVTKCPFFGTWQEKGPFDLPNAHIQGAKTVRNIHPVAIPGVEGNSVPVQHVRILTADENIGGGRIKVYCPDCGTEVKKPTENEGWVAAKRHNESMHGAEPVAGIPENHLSE